MIRVSVEVRNEGTHFNTPVWAESIERAVHLARARYRTSEVRVLFPIDGESFFAMTTATASVTMPPDAPEEVMRIGKQMTEVQQSNGKVELL